MNLDNRFKHDLSSLGKTNMLKFNRSLTIIKKMTNLRNLNSINNEIKQKIPDDLERLKERIKRLHRKKYVKGWNTSEFLKNLEQKSPPNEKIAKLQKEYNDVKLKNKLQPL